MQKFTCKSTSTIKMKRKKNWKSSKSCRKNLFFMKREFLLFYFYFRNFFLKSCHKHFKPHKIFSYCKWKLNFCYNFSVCKEFSFDEEKVSWSEQLLNLRSKFCNVIGWINGSILTRYFNGSILIFFKSKLIIESFYT